MADLDHVKDEVLLRRPAEPAEEVEAARAIVSQEVDRFEAWRRAARLAPLIQALRDRGERALAAEVARLGPRVPGAAAAVPSVARLRAPLRGAPAARAGGVTAFTAYRSDSKGFFIVQTVTSIAVCVAFMAVARILSKKAQQQKSDASDNPPKL